MPSLSLILLAAVWLLGCWARIVRLARFYQIEEYMSRRFFAWLQRTPRQLLPRRALAAWATGMALVLALAQINAPSDAPQEALAFSVLLLAALVAILPQGEGEVKKALVRTGRVKRMLAGAIFCAALAQGAALLLAFNFIHAAKTDANPGTSSPELLALAMHSIGFILLLLAPAWLTLGNLLLQPYERYQRRRFLARARATLDLTQPKIIGITGSYGKTTTKDFLRHIMSLRYRAYATPKSYNTLMGICLAINRDLADDYRTEYFISEMGAYVPGEINRICQLTPPDLAIVTEIGPQHLERFGSLENTMRAKYEIIKNLQPDGVAVFNWDNAYIRQMAAKGHPKTRLSVSRELSLAEARRQDVSWLASDIRASLQGLRFTLTRVASGENIPISAPVLGEHNVSNLLLCIAVACHEGMPLRDVALRIGSLQPAESRLVRQATASGITIINDAYSANPKGVVSALKVLGMHTGGKRLLITPGMIELGALQERENRVLGKLAGQYATDIMLIGRQQTKPIYEGIRAAGFDMARLHVTDTLSEAVAWYQERLGAGDTVLFLNDLPDTY